MNKLDLAQLLAKQSHRSRGKAADAVDALVYRMLKDIKTPKPLLHPVSARVAPPPASDTQCKNPRSAKDEAS